MDVLYKCGYCGFLLSSQCENLLEHSCLKDIYDEKEHLLVEDEKKVLTIVQKDTRRIVGAKPHPMLISFDEQLIKYVQDRPALYNLRMPLLARTNTKKEVLWQEIVNLFGGQVSVEDVQKKWKYLRDCYIRAKKKVTKYIPSGSGAAPLPDPGFRYYEAMKCIDDGASQKYKTVCSVTAGPSGLPVTAGPSGLPVTAGPSGLPVTAGPSGLPVTAGPSGLPVTAGPSGLPVTAGPSSQFYSPPLSVTTPLTSPDSDVRSGVRTPQTKRRKTNDREATIEKGILEALASPPRLDGVDGFLLRLGESLRNLPYRERSQLEIQIMQLVFETESRINM